MPCIPPPSGVLNLSKGSPVFKSSLYMNPNPVSVDLLGLEAECPLEAVHRYPSPTVIPDPFAVGVYI